MGYRNGERYNGVKPRNTMEGITMMREDAAVEVVATDGGNLGRV